MEGQRSTANMSQPLHEHDVWFRDGLRFECTRCGHCCTGEPGFVWVDAAELERIAAHLGEPLEQVAKLYARPAGKGTTLREKANGDCVFYDAMQGCTVYAARPTQCRTWPFWESNVRSEAAWKRTCEDCPGSGHGELIPPEAILERIRAIRL
jgi:hypothetical protein